MNKFRKQILFLCDSAILAGIIALLYHYTSELSVSKSIISEGLRQNLLLLYGCTVVFQFVFHIYDSIWRYAESREYLLLLLTALCGFSSYEILCRLFFPARLPFIFLCSVAGLWVIGMLFIRFVYRVYLSKSLHRYDEHQRPTAIVGAGQAGVRLLNELQRNRKSRFHVVCFFDDDLGKIGKKIRGIPVKGRISDIAEYRQTMNIQEIIVAIPSISEKKRQSILQQLSELPGVKVSILPGTLELVERRPIHLQLREIRIEDLLGRKPVQLDNSPVKVFLEGKTVLVTGGGGSIGSELCRQIAKFRPARLIIVDIYENNAYDIQQELTYHYGKKLNLVVEIASVRDRDRVEQIFETYRPDVVFHAAAHKHVPLMETSPQEAVRNNVFGTLNLVRAADRFHVRKFIQVSTDKAVNPTSVMGATKRMCEIILQSMKGRSQTTFAAVRFGNVLGSNGSVVPLFKREIAAGGPVTVTDKRIIRYFMTIPEAAQLVLQAGAMASQNELYVLDMGQPVKIIDLAENLIRLCGYMPYQDIDIIETGLRPGEKLYEEPLITGRNIEKTTNNQIFVEQQPIVTPEELRMKLEILQAALDKNDPGCIRSALHQVIPTFREPEEVNIVRQSEKQPQKLAIAAAAQCVPQKS